MTHDHNQRIDTALANINGISLKSAQNLLWDSGIKATRNLHDLNAQEKADILQVVHGKYPSTYKEWIILVKDFKGGLVGHLIALSTLPVTLICAVFGISIFPPGHYPQIILAIPGLLLGFIFFLAMTGLYWKLVKSKTAPHTFQSAQELLMDAPHY